MPAPGSIRIAASLIAPPRCGICGGSGPAQAAACWRCSRALETAAPGVAAIPELGLVHWAAPYEGVARALIAALKFRGRLALAALAAETIVASLPARSLDGVVAVPPAPARLRRRGFDAAESIAAAVADSLQLPLRRCLRRGGDRRQVGRPRAERLASPPRVRPAARAPARVLLIDDVLTTGATLSACAGALRDGGSDEIEGAVFARSPGAYPDR